MSLIPQEKLQTAHASFEQNQAANVTTAKPTAFVYQPRATMPVYKIRGAVPVAVPVVNVPVVMGVSAPVVTVVKGDVTPVVTPVVTSATVALTPDADDYTVRKPKKGKQVCICGHQYDQHCTEPPLQHWPASEGSYGFFFCISEHCEAVPCDCWAFRATADEIPTMKRRKADDFTPCAAPGCGHRRALHCHASRKPVIPGTYQGFQLEGIPYGCKHGPSDGNPWYVCSTASCAEVGCLCTKYRNSLLKPRTAKATTAKPTAPRVSRAESAHKAKVLVEVVREDATITVKELAEASERSPAWVRSTLKKAGITLGKSCEKNAFVTGSAVNP
jgi:hypothetical protein